MSDAFRSIEQGLKEALAQARGEGAATIHQIELAEPDLRATRVQADPAQEPI